MQEFQVLQCAECSTFQVDIAKKARKWNCKICDTQQSVKIVYFTSYAAKESREKAQEMNMNARNAKTSKHNALVNKLEDSDEGGDKERFTQSLSSETKEIVGGNVVSYCSKWSKYTKHHEQDQSSQSHEESQEIVVKSLSQTKAVKNNNNNGSVSSTRPYSSTSHSIYHQWKPVALPKLIDLHKKPPKRSNEPPSKKLKQETEDDFELSQDDWNLIDSLK